jgi:hypothetical protein
VKNKTIFFVGLLLALSPVLFAQNWLVGGSADVFFDKGKNGSTTSDDYGFTLSPFVGYRLTEKLDLGARLTFAVEKDYSKTFGIGPRVRYVLLEWGRLQLLVQGDIGFEYTIYDASTTKDRITASIAASPAAQFNLTERVSLYTTIGNAGYWLSWRESDDYTSEFFISLTDGIALGFLVRL